MTAQDRTERIAHKIAGESQIVARRKYISLKNIKYIRITVFPIRITGGTAREMVASSSIEGPAYSLKDIRSEIDKKRIEFKVRAIGKNDFNDLNLTRDQATEILKQLNDSEYVETKPPLPIERRKGRGDDCKLDVYKTYIAVEKMKVRLYIKFCLDEKGVFNISFHKDNKQD